MKIVAVDTRLASLPLPHGPWGDTIHHVTHIEIVVTEVTTDSGLVGTGFSHTSGVGGTTIRALIEQDLGPFIVGAEASPRGLWSKCWKHVHDMGGGGVSTMALAAIDIALWDLQAKEARKSLTAFLGQCHEKIPVYASGINLNKSEDELIDQVKGWVKDGFNSFKVKVGKPEIEEDVERLTKVREVIGRRPLMVDANQGWDIGKATRAINAYEHLNPTWIEEPLLCDDIDGHARLRQLVRSPIALGENVYTIQQFNQYLSRGACDFVQADIVRVGGITPYLEIAALARAWNVPLAPHFMMELTGQVLCCLPNSYILENIDGGSLSDLRALVRPFRIVDGYFTPPMDVLGHGIEFDREALQRHAVA
ncbi:MAG: mandelate racemase/muconate lactonizing enzyme family protein [Betaproteobacteria bacterium]